MSVSGILSTRLRLHWTRGHVRVLMGDPEGIAILDGIVAKDHPIGIALGLTAWVDVTHLPSGKKIASFRTLGAAMEFVEHALTLDVEWRSPLLRFTLPEAAYLREMIGALRQTESPPIRV